MICDMHLGLYQEAKRVAEEISITKLNREKQLKLYYLTELDFRDPAKPYVYRTFSFSPSVGALSYSSASQTFTSGSYFDAVGAYTYGSTTVAAGFNHVSIQLKPSGSFNQNQFTGLIYKSIVPVWGLQAGASLLLNDDSDTNGAWAFSLASRWFSSSGSELLLGGHFSNYVNYSPKSIQVFQFNPKASWNIGAALLDELPLFLDLTAIWILPRISAATSATLHQSVDAGIRTTIGELSLGAGFWKGSQVFAVKNTGFTVINQELERTMGVRASLGWKFNSSLSVTGLFSRESLQETTQITTSIDHIGVSASISL